MISSNWSLFQEEVVKIKHNLENNFSFIFLNFILVFSFIDKQIKSFLDNKMDDENVTLNSSNIIVKYYKWPFGDILTDDRYQR